MNDKIIELYEKYKFDYIYINPKDIDNIKWEFVGDEIYGDFKSEQTYLGSIEHGDISINVYYDKKITPGDVIFKYENIKKERNIKLKDLFNYS
jgi:hypothetical protein